MTERVNSLCEAEVESTKQEARGLLVRFNGKHIIRILSMTA